MQRTDICGEEIIIATKEELRKLWNDPAIDNSKLWSEEESWKHCLDSPEQLAEVIDKKRRKPGRY